MVAGALAFVEVEGAWTDETAWCSTDILSCCCAFVLSFGSDCVCDVDSGCGCDVLGCTGVCMMCADLTLEELVWDSLEVEGAEPGSPARTPEDALL